MYNFRRLINIPIKRYFSNTTRPNKILEHLKDRSLIRVSGQGVSDFLQGLITNDIKHLQNGSGSMFTMLLNTKGRVLYDAIIYRTAENGSYLVECDTQALESYLKHFKIYRVRRKIDIENLRDDYKVYSLFDSNCIGVESGLFSEEAGGFIVPCDKLNDTLPETITSTKFYKDLLIFKDPRVSHLGSRIIAKPKVDVGQQISEICEMSESTENQNYRWFRYSLGIGEGTNDLPQGVALPLECNCDYLHGVSFHKGCYIGQELTARTHHTGVVRKRYMPLYFTKIPTKLPENDIILHENVNLGKLRGVIGNVGLGLLRISKAMDFGEITVGNGVAKVVKPSWWPLEVTKEKVGFKKLND